MEEFDKYFLVNGIKVHWNFKLLPSGFEAITLFGHVFDVQSKESLRKYLTTYSGKVTVNHERIHMLQAETFKSKYFGFYVYYIWYWIVGLFKYFNSNKSSYSMIPFEQEAYRNQYDFNYSKSNWRDFV
jgi:hypothetical protein